MNIDVCSCTGAHGATYVNLHISRGVQPSMHTVYTWGCTALCMCRFTQVGISQQLCILGAEIHLQFALYGNMHPGSRGKVIISIFPFPAAVSLDYHFNM